MSTPKSEVILILLLVDFCVFLFLFHPDLLRVSVADEGPCTPDYLKDEDEVIEYCHSIDNREGEKDANRRRFPGFLSINKSVSNAEKRYHDEDQMNCHKVELRSNFLPERILVGVKWYQEYVSEAKELDKQNPTLAKGNSQNLLVTLKLILEDVNHCITNENWCHECRPEHQQALVCGHEVSSFSL